VGRAAALLGRRRALAFAALAVVVVLYYALRTHLHDLPFWWDVTLLVFPIIPVVLALVYLLLPLYRLPERHLIGAAVVLALAAWLFQHVGWGLAANFAKLFAPTFAGWWFLGLFEDVSWVVIVACIIPFVDAYSVFWGPTNAITKHHFEVYSSVAFAFVVPNHSAAQIGPPDVLFFALFLAAASRFGLRVWLTFVLTTLSFGATVVIANATNVDGLPALPLLSFGFLAANADVLLARRRSRNL
jgi:hypothetical protein